jgi:hypothetical protein
VYKIDDFDWFFFFCEKNIINFINESGKKELKTLLLAKCGSPLFDKWAHSHHHYAYSHHG